MNNSIIHYQTSFRVSNPDGEAFKQLKRNVYGWIVDREADRVLKERTNDFFFRCDWPNLFQTHASLLTNTFLSETSEAWAMHYTEPDRSLGRKRFWYTDIGFKKDGDTVIVSVRNSELEPGQAEYLARIIVNCPANRSSVNNKSSCVNASHWR